MSSPGTDPARRRTWLVTGASRGFGLEIARAALSRGDAVVATARDPQVVREALAEDAGDRLLAVALDVTDPASVRAAVEGAVARFGGIDVLVNNAGHGIVGGVEEVSDAETRGVFEVNLFGVLAVTRAVLPVMREQRAGRILMMSSMGGFAQPGSGWGVYGASKFAVEGLSEALSHEVGPLGIHVTLVEPGSFRTDFLAGSSIRLAETRIDDYDETVGPTRARAGEAGGTQPGDPASAAEAILALTDDAEPPLRLPLGGDAVDLVRAKLAQVEADVARVEGLARGTAYPV